MNRFAKYQGSFNPYYVWHINEEGLELLGGGDWCDGSEDPVDEETQARANEIAKEFGMRTTKSYGRWEGYSEYTPDPGDISHFDWEPL